MLIMYVNMCILQYNSIKDKIQSLQMYAEIKITFSLVSL